MSTTFKHSKFLSLAVICLCQVLAMSLWFSATALVPALSRTATISPFRMSLFTSAVQVGFVVGTLISAFLLLADRVEPRRLFMICSLAAAASNACIMLATPGSIAMVACRFLTGMFLAGIYPVGMRMAATWAENDMGLIVGLLVGALTLGSASPHLLNAVGGLDWRFTLAASSFSGVIAAFVILGAGLGPKWKPASRYDPGAALNAWRNRPLRLVNIGYFGHMWELYAMWAWIGTFLNSGFLLSMKSDDADSFAKFATFGCVAIGCAGCLAAGFLADRLGRTTITMTALAISGLCSLTVGFFWGGNAWIVIALCAVWGVSVVADSAQFSASIAELSSPSYVGTMLTIQTSIGFLITLITIHLTPVLAGHVGWRFAFAPLALGPAAGIFAMAKLRRSPEARLLANGRR